MSRILETSSCTRCRGLGTVAGDARGRVRLCPVCKPAREPGLCGGCGRRCGAAAYYCTECERDAARASTAAVRKKETH